MYKVSYPKLLSFFASFFFIISIGNGQSIVSQKVQSARSLIMSRSVQQPFTEVQSDKSELVKYSKDIPSARYLKIDKSHTRELMRTRSNYLKIGVPGPEGEMLELLMYQYELHNNESVIRTASNKPFQSNALFYHGIVNGKNNSIVALSIFENEMVGMIQVGGENYTLGRLEDNEDYHVLYNVKDISDKFTYDCYTDIKEHYIGRNGEVNFRAPNSSNCVNMYIEVDNTIYVNKGSVAATANYVNGAMNEVALLYSNELIEFGVSEMVIWDVTDPYPGPSSSDYLNQFRTNLNGVYNGDLAHLVGFGGGGGIAYVDVLCNSVYGIGYSGISSSYNNVPSYSWTVEVLTHEIGHNLGSRHTHDCVWNGNNTPIDGCGPAAGYSAGCDGPLPSSGTIMSYCHLVSGVGIDFNNGFGPQPGDLIRSRVYNATCLAPCAPCGTTGQPCDDNDDCTTNDTYDSNCNCIGTLLDSDNDGVCDADDICPGANDALDTDNDGTPDCIECTGAYSTKNFGSSPLTHSGGGSSSTSLNYPFGTQDVAFTISGINQRTNGKQSNKYQEQVTVSFVDGNGQNQIYGIYSAPNTSSVTVNINQVISQVMVSLEDIYDGNTASTMSINLSQVTACEPEGGCPDDDNDGVCNIDDICPGGNDNIDTDNDGIPDYCDTDTCPNATDQFSENPLTHQGSGVSGTTINFLSGTADVSFDITNIDSRTKGNPSKKYTDKVTVDYVDGSGNTITYGSYFGDSIGSTSVSISSAVQSVTVYLEDSFDGDTGSETISVNLSDVSSCNTPSSTTQGVISDEYNVYPNPSIGRVFVDLGSVVKKNKMMVYDILGKLIIEQTIEEKRMIEIDLPSSSSPIIYFISIRDEMGQTKTKKIVVLN